MSISKKLGSSFIWTAMQITIRTLTQLAVLYILSRELTIEEFGIGTVAVSIFFIIWPMFEIGLESTIIQRPKLEESTKLLGSAWTVSIIIAVIAGLIILISSLILPTILNLPQLHGLLLFFVGVVLIRSWAIIPLGMQQRHLNFRLLMIIESISIIFGLGGATFICLYLGGGYWAFPIGIGSYYIISSILLISFSPKKLKIIFSTSKIKEIATYSLGYAAPSGINTISREADKLLVQYFLGLRFTGIYGRAVQVYQMPSNFLGQIVEKVMFPFLVKKDNEQNYIYNTVTKGTYLFSLLIMPFSVLIFFTAESIVLLLLGKGWEEVVPPLQILTIGMFFRTNSKLYDSVLRASGDVYVRSKQYFINFIILMLIILSFVKYGVAGISWAVVFSSVIFNYQLLFVINKNVGCFKGVLKSLKSGVVLSIIFIVISLLMDNFLNINSGIYKIFLYLLALAVIYLLYFLFFIKKTMVKIS